MIRKIDSRFILSSSLFAICFSYPAAGQDFAPPVDIGTLGGLSAIAYAISADGHVIVGYAGIATGQTHAASWTNGAITPTDLGTLGGKYSSAYAVSADGRVIIGQAEIAAGFHHAVSWTNGATTPTDLGILSGTISTAKAVSADGRVIVGEADIAIGAYRAVSWVNGAITPTDLGALGGTASAAKAVSADGSVIVGSANIVGEHAHAASWVNGTLTPTDLGTLGGSNSTAAAVSADGRVIVGHADIASGAYHAASWTNGAVTPTDLGTLGGNASSAKAVSADGRVIIGQAYIAAGSHHAVSWTNGAITPTDLGTLGGNASSAAAISANGSVIIASATTAGGAYHAALWINGAVTPTDLGTLGGNASFATAVSADGHVIVGYANIASGAEHAALWKVKPTTLIIDVNNTIEMVAALTNDTVSVMEMQRMTIGRLQNFCDVSKAGETCYSVMGDVGGLGGNKEIISKFSLAHAFTDSFSAGISIAHSLWRDLPDNYDSNSNNIGGGLYAKWQDTNENGNWYIRGAVSANRYDVTMTRQVVPNTEAGTGQSRTSGWIASLELGQSHELKSNAVMGYYGGLRYSDLGMDGYTETNAEFPFSYSNVKYQLTTAYLGANYGMSLSERVKWSVNAEIEQDLAHKDPSVVASAAYIGTLKFDSDLVHTRGSLSTTLSYAFNDSISIGITPYVARASTRNIAFGALVGFSGKF